MAPTFGAVTYVESANATVVTTNHTVTGTLPLLVVLANNNGAGGVSTLEFDSTGLTKLASATRNFNSCELWYLLNPNVKAAAVEATYGASEPDISLTILHYNAVKASQTPASTTANSYGSIFTQTITPATAVSLIIQGVNYEAVSSLVPGAGQTERDDSTTFAYTAQVSDRTEATGASVMSSTATGDDNFCGVTGVFEPEPVAVSVGGMNTKGLWGDV